MEYPVNQRIKVFFESLNIKKIDFARALGMDRSETITNIIEHKHEVSLPLIQKISEKYERISMEWLMRGEGNMLKTSMYEQTKNAATQHHNNTVEEDPGEPMGYDTNEIVKLKKEIELLKIKNQHTEELLLKLYERTLPVQKEAYKQRGNVLD